MRPFKPLRRIVPVLSSVRITPRRKSLPILLVLAFGLSTSPAPTIRGYINISLTNGFNLIANQLDYDGTRTNNTLWTVFNTNLPSGSTVYKFTNGIYTSSSYVAGLGWLPNGDATLNPGEGAVVSLPPGQSKIVTFVGEVWTGNLTNSYPAGYSIISSQVPDGAGLVGFVPNNGDKVYSFNSRTQSYSSATFVTDTGWHPSEPSMAVGEAVFLNAAMAGTWTSSFNP